MKKYYLYITAVFFFSTSSVFGENLPSGRVMELHDCELIAGGCIVSSESTLGGRSLLRVWDFADGSHSGQNLTGLKVALLQIARKNLAFPSTLPAGNVIYLPPEASLEQHKALVDWLRTEEPAVSAGIVEEKIVPIEISGSGETISLKIGQNISLQTQSVVPAGPDHCNGMLWYSPRTRLNTFKVLLNRKSTVREKSLELTWNNHYAKSVFLGSFGKAAVQFAANANNPEM